uniref:Mastermind-like 1/3 transactivation domain-containing protein n=1 Tax=Nothoprocta perdicaria TaxID=30464 RepID=A0A8C6Z4G2_NOTPE
IADLSPAEQLKQMAAQQQQRAKLMQQKQQHPNQASSWSPVGPPSSPYGGPFSADKPNSPMMYPQAFNNQNPIVPPMANNPQKPTINNYLPQNHMNMINQQPNNLGTNSLSKQPNMLSYGNTKPLSHFSAELSQRITPPMANASKNPMLPYIQQQQQAQQPQMQAQMAHLSEEQKRLLIMKQKGMMNQPMAYATLPSLGQVSDTCRRKTRACWLCTTIEGLRFSSNSYGLLLSSVGSVGCHYRCFLDSLCDVGARSFHKMIDLM